MDHKAHYVLVIKGNWWTIILKSCRRDCSDLHIILGKAQLCRVVSINISDLVGEIHVHMLFHCKVVD